MCRSARASIIRYNQARQAVLERAAVPHVLCLARNSKTTVPNSGQRGGGAVQNPIDTQAGEWSLADDNVPHSFVFSGTYELPFGKGSTGPDGQAASRVDRQWHPPL